ncbi:MAG: hypothetical protein ACQERC_05565 [Bacteroidota bacterium]
MKITIYLLLLSVYFLLNGCNNEQDRNPRFDRAYKNKQEALEEIKRLSADNSDLEKLLLLSLSVNSSLFAKNTEASLDNVDDMLMIRPDHNNLLGLSDLKSKIIELDDYFSSQRIDSLKSLQELSSNSETALVSDLSNNQVETYEERLFMIALVSQDLNYLNQFDSIFPKSRFKNDISELKNSIRTKNIMDSLESIERDEHIEFDIYDYPNHTNYNSSPVYPSTPNTNVNPNANPDKVHVKGYYRKNGTYVKPHIRTAPNQTKTDNLRYNPFK